MPHQENEATFFDVSEKITTNQPGFCMHFEKRNAAMMVTSSFFERGSVLQRLSGIRKNNKCHYN